MNYLIKKKIRRIFENEQRLYVYLTVLSLGLLVTGLLIGPINSIPKGLYDILISPSQLSTDYLQLAGIPATLINVSILLLLSLFMMYFNQTHINAAAIGALSMMAGFSFFGKNLFNSIPMMIGVYLYAKLEKTAYRNYILMALFSSCLGPVVSYLAFSGVIEAPWSIAVAWLVGIFIGFILPPLAAQFIGFHQGYSLYNSGFTAGITGMIITSVIYALDWTVDSNRILYDGSQRFILIGMMYTLCTVILLSSLLLIKREPIQFKELWQLSGRLPSSFIEMTNLRTAGLNVASLGYFLTTYVLILYGEINGPIIGGIIGAMGFGVFGNHLKNTVPVVLGISFGAYLHSGELSTTSIVVAVLFGTNLAPIAGYYGAIAGFISGMLHVFLVGHIVYLHGGLNLYNNGFSGGFVAAFMVPILDAITNVKNVFIKARSKNE